MTPITQKFIQQSLLGFNLGAQITPAGGNIRDNNDGNAADGGKFRKFANGSVYWKNNLGAHKIHGSILSKYSDLGFEYGSSSSGALGYPISDEKPGILHPNNRYSEFENGVLYWNGSTVTKLIPVSIFHLLIEVQITQIIQSALSSTMTGGTVVNVGAIGARINSVQPYQYHQLSYPVGGRQFEVFTNRRYLIRFSIPFTNPSGTAQCEIILEFKTNLLGQIVFVLRDFQFSLGFLDIARWCIGGSIDDSILPLCNQEKVVDFSAIPNIPSGSKFLCAHINTPSIGTGNPHDLLLYREP